MWCAESEYALIESRRELESQRQQFFVSQSEHAQRERIHSVWRIGDEWPSSSRKLCKKLQRNWRIKKTLLSRGKYWKTTKIVRNSDAAWSGIPNSESFLLRSWLIEQLWHTCVPHQALITSRSRKPSREVGMPRMWVFLETFLIVYMLNEILMNYTVIQEIWQQHWRFWEQKELRKMGAKNHCNQCSYLACRGKQEKKSKWQKLFYVYDLPCLGCLDLFSKHDSSELSPPRRCICRIPWRTEFQSWVVNFRAEVHAKARNKRKGQKSYTERKTQECFSAEDNWVLFKKRRL